MKKNYLTYALILFLASANSVSAKGIQPVKQAKPKVNLKEIVLDTKSDYILPQSQINLADGELTGQAVSTETNIIPVNNLGTASKKEFKFFRYLNPIRPITKGQQLIEKGATFIDNDVDADLNKLKRTPLEGIQKTDDFIDNSVVKTDTAVKKFFGYLDKGTDTGLGKIDETIASATNKTAVQEWLEADDATKKYFGMKPVLESHGLSIDTSFLYSPFMKTSGGASGEGGAKGYSLFSIGVTLDTEKANLWKGGKFFALYQRKAGMGMSGTDGAMGDYFGFDGWNMPEVNQISEYWYQQKLFNGKIRMKFGKQDSNSDFGYLQSGWDFMNTAFSVTPTSPLPSFPNPPFGFMLEVSPKEWLSIKNGIYSKDSAPFYVSEIEFKPMIRKLPGRYKLGGWVMGDSNGYITTQGVDGSGNTIYNNFYRNTGMYFNFEQMVYKEQKENPNDMQGLVLFGQFGIASADKNDLGKYGSLGLNYKGPIPKRDNDIAGVAVGTGNFASRLNNITYGVGGRMGNETVIEVFYRFFITKWFYLQPDVQFIMNPNGQYANSTAIGIRSVITF